jgi:5-methylcytosine-specific restriction endonuclease McrA
VFGRDGFKCAKCGALDDLTIDHVVPKSLGGENSQRNYQTLCRQCNLEKGASVALYVKHRRVKSYVKRFAKNNGLHIAGHYVDLINA